MNSESIDALKGVLMPLVGKFITLDKQDITAFWVDDVIHDITLMVRHGMATVIDVDIKGENNSLHLATYYVEADDITSPDAIDSNMEQYLKNQKGTLIIHVNYHSPDNKKLEFPHGMKKNWDNGLNGCSFSISGWACS